jgi:arsenate reductase (thioredoxin)
VLAGRFATERLTALAQAEGAIRSDVCEVLFVCVHDAGRSQMAEVGVDITAEFPEPLTDDVVRAADVVVTMGCGDACPVHPGKRYLDWQVRDPAGLFLGEVGAIRADIDTRVRARLAERHPAAAPA